MGRVLGRSGIEVSEIGLGCWAIGGPFTMNGRPDGWGEVDDAESVAAIQRAVELGITFFDTADVYGAGHSEEVLGRALAGRRDEVVIATKVGYTFDAGRRAITVQDASPSYIRRACRASLRRLGTEWIDLYQLHLGDLPVTEAQQATLEELVTGGLIRSYGWSTDPQRVAASATGAHCAAIQHELNVLADAPASSRRPGRRAVWVQPGHPAILRADRPAGRHRPGAQPAPPVPRPGSGVAGGAALPARHGHADRADEQIRRAGPRRAGHPGRASAPARRARRAWESR